MESIMAKATKQSARLRRKMHIRKNYGTAERPRLGVFRSAKHTVSSSMTMHKPLF